MRTYRQKRCCWRKTGEVQGFGTGARPVKDAAGSLVPGDEHAAGEEKDEDDEGGSAQTDAFGADAMSTR